MYERQASCLQAVADALHRQAALRTCPALCTDVVHETQVTTLRADNAHTSAEVAQLAGKNERMQALIKDMASQMEVLQGNLSKQTAVVARLEAALTNQGMAVAEIEDLHKNQSLQLKWVSSPAVPPFGVGASPGMQGGPCLGRHHERWCFKATALLVQTCAALQE
jgi:hypothetical protein